MRDRPIAIRFGGEARDLQADQRLGIACVFGEALLRGTRLSFGHHIVQLEIVGINAHGSRQMKLHRDAMQGVQRGGSRRVKKLAIKRVILLAVGHDLLSHAQCIAMQRHIVAPHKRPVI